MQLEIKNVANCVDFVTVHHCTKFRSHICNIGDCNSRRRNTGNGEKLIKQQVPLFLL